MAESDYQRGLRGGDFAGSYEDDRAWQDWDDGRSERDRLQRERERERDAALDRETREFQEQRKRDEERYEASLPRKERERRRAARAAKEKAAARDRDDELRVCHLADHLVKRGKARAAARQRSRAHSNKIVGTAVTFGLLVGIGITASAEEGSNRVLPFAICVGTALMLSAFIGWVSFLQSERQRKREAAADDIEWDSFHTYSASRDLVAFCAVANCQCQHPKRCTSFDCDCDRPKVCPAKDCDCGFTEVCSSPSCECYRPKIATSDHFMPVVI